MKITVSNNQTHTVLLRVRVMRDGQAVDTTISILPKSKPTLEVEALLDNIENAAIANRLGLVLLSKEDPKADAEKAAKEQAKSADPKAQSKAKVSDTLGDK